MTTTRNRHRALTWVKPMVASMAFILAAVPAAQAFAASDEPAVVYPAYQGPKKTIAVTRFDAIGSFVAQHGDWDVGGGLAAMLAGELARTNRFVVVERAELDTLLREKQLAQANATRGTGGGPLLGAQTFIRGSVTSFDQQEKGGGLNFGLNLPGFSGAASARKAVGHIAIDLRLIDGETGAVLMTSHVERKIQAGSIALQGATGRFNFGGDRFNQTSLGRASREAIESAVAQIVAGMERVPFQALVARSDGDRVFLNAGRNANLVPGSRMRVTRAIDRVSDPVTGEVLGERRQTIADVVIDQVEDRYSVARLIGASMHVEPSDVAQLVER